MFNNNYIWDILFCSVLYRAGGIFGARNDMLNPIGMLIPVGMDCPLNSYRNKREHSIQRFEYFSLGIGQKQSFWYGPKQNAKMEFKHHHRLKGKGLLNGKF